MLANADFHLTDPQLASLGEYVRQQAKAFVAEGEDAATSVVVEFAFVVGFGRRVTVRFDGEPVGREIESL